MHRLLARVAAIAALTPVVLVIVMVAQVPPSALTVPNVQIATASEPIRLTPDALGASRTLQGLQVREDRLDTTLAQLSEQLRREPVQGGYQKTDDGIVLNHGVPGAELDVERARIMLVEALRSGRSDLTLPVVEVPAPEPMPYAIVARLSDFRLDLYEGAALRKSYPIGIGKLNFPTPPGQYHIRSKAKNPTWRRPNSAWARGMPAVVGPGPRNPLGTRALRLDRDALVIHGTPQPASVGRRSSHGCMRMYKADVEELFEIVPVNTSVFIVP